jgi:beta-galactosidase/beta-glucuronidase
MATSLPRPEYPRPQFVREAWLNLNGEWEFEETPDLANPPLGRRLSGRILAPFAPESKLSGIGKTDFMPAVWYRRAFTIPAEWKDQRIVLQFGAVDYEAMVWVNGQLAGSHRGGYVPFQFDITALLRAGENELVVGALDDTRSPLQPTGKQSDRTESYGCLYTRTTGIWQTVWLEPVPPAHLTRMRLYPDIDAGRLCIQVWADKVEQALSVEAVASVNSSKVDASVVSIQGGFATLMLKIEKPRLWSPADPFLYDLELKLTDGKKPIDRVESYFGMRKISLQSPAINLNNQPLFQRLVLDQGFYPDGIYTAPDDAALKRDIELSQQVGFNGARLHQKVFEPRFLYWADKLGYLVWGEFADWGLARDGAESLERMLPEWLTAVERDFNHPSIVGWCPFNETNKEQRPELLHTIYQVTKAIDGTRPVIDTSGYVHVETDVDDSHNYEQNPETFAALFADFAKGGRPYRNFAEDAPHAGQPYFVSEYGGIWWNPQQADEKSWGYGERPKGEEEFLHRYRGLTETLLFHPKMCGFCYTQLYDIEQEVNGLYTYDRRAKFDPAILRAINAQKAAIEK